MIRKFANIYVMSIIGYENVIVWHCTMCTCIVEKMVHCVRTVHLTIAISTSKKCRLAIWHNANVSRLAKDIPLRLADMTIFDIKAVRKTMNYTFINYTTTDLFFIFQFCKC